MDIYSHQDKFIENKYYHWYYSIIESAKCQPRKRTKDQYFESHHVLPRSMFPEYSKDKWNLVLLTPREHFICHWLLVKFTSDEFYYKMCKALHKMLQNRSFSSRYYEIARKYNSISMMGDNNPSRKYGGPNKGKVYTEEQRRRVSLSHIGLKYPNKKPFSEETKNKMSLAASYKYKNRPDLKAAAQLRAKTRKCYFHPETLETIVLYDNSEPPVGYIKGYLKNYMKLV